MVTGSNRESNSRTSASPRRTVVAKKSSGAASAV